ncbi:MAG TPA: ABC transporter substrate-binding protein [Candidatus Binatia bacterium]
MLLTNLSVAAQQPKKVARIGYLSALDPALESARSEAIRRALRDLGYVEGQNLAIEYRYTERKAERAPEAVADLVRLKVDLIVVTAGDQWIQAAKDATRTIPIVMVGQGIDPVHAGLVESLARPGGNITGVTNLYAELGGKRLEVFKDIVVKMGRVAVIYDPAIRSNIFETKEVLPAAARALGLTIRSWEVRDSDGFDQTFAALMKERPDGLYVPPGPLMNANQRKIANFALSNRLPSTYVRREFVEVGGMMSYGADILDSYRHVAVYVDKILKGARPGDLPVEQPTKFELVINLKTAKQIGLTIPPNVLARADRVIK